MSKVERALNLQKVTSAVLNQLDKVEEEGDELIVLEQVARFLGMRLTDENQHVEKPSEPSPVHGGPVLTE